MGTAPARSALVVAALVASVLVAVAPPSAADHGLHARGSLGQVAVWGADPDASLELVDAGEAVVATGTADAQGAYLFGVAPEAADDIPAGTYTVRVAGDTGSATEPVEVFAVDFDPPPGQTIAAAPPDDSIYDPASQDLLPSPANRGAIDIDNDDGFGYLRTRDGTTLSVHVMAPILAPNVPEEGPYPVVVNYSGYTPSDPQDDDPVNLLLRAAGYAVVGVNLRGTGCSGGAYSYFEPLQALDGYDVIEALARQPWVAGSGTGEPQVGMAGISFPGISQLFVARTNPPSLAGVTPLSVIADSYRSILYPGGVLNDGFATEWVQDREDQAEPEGQAWAASRIAGGDTDCEGNQELRLQAPPLVERFEIDLLYEADPGDVLAPAAWVDEIQVPTFIAGAFQDEQTGGHWSTMLDDFDTATEVGAGQHDLKRAVLFNGTHADALGPDVLRDVLEFLDIYVARRPLGPQANNALRGLAPAELTGTFGAPYAIAPWRGFAGQPPEDRVVNRTQYEARDTVVLRWERGARGSEFCEVVRTPPPLGQAPDVDVCDDTTGDGVPDEPVTEGDGALFGRYETTYETWPPPGLSGAGGAQSPAAFHLDVDGRLSDTPNQVPDDRPRGWSSYTHSSARDQVTSYAGGSESIWHKDATYTWAAPPEASSRRFVTEPFTDLRAFAGTGSVDLWVRTDAPGGDVDLEVTLTEVRDDGQEIYVQSGWHRASLRAESPGSTPLDPQYPFTAAEPLPEDEFARVRVELFPFAHLVRPGSRLALTVAGPGGNRPFWRFASPDDADGSTVDLGHSVGRPSALTLPEVEPPVEAAGSTETVCGDLRSQPCRTTPASTRPTQVTATVDSGVVAEAALDRGIDVTWTAPEVPGASGYEVGILPSGEELPDDATPGLRIPVPEGAPPPAGNPSYTVTATGIPDVGAGQPSTASAPLLDPHPFSDVPRTRWYAESVDWLSAWEVASGFPDFTFRPKDSVNRAQFAAWLWNLFGQPAATGDGHPFTDVPGGVWYEPALDWAEDEGIVAGFPDDTFRPKDPVNRGQASNWLWVASGEPAPAVELPFTDLPADPWYGDGLKWAYGEGVVSGFDDATFRPRDPVNRGQASSWFEATAGAILA